MKEYKEAIKDLIENKFFIGIIILVTILSYGFAITHYSIGVDDTSFYRYYANGGMLTAGRYGMWSVYNILNIKEFTPFWADLVATLVIVLNAIMWCAFFKKQFKDKFNIIPYIIFVSIFISYPLVNETFIYQNSNIAILLSSILISLSSIIIFENFELKKKRLYIIAILIAVFAIGIYESSCQTFLVSMGMLSIVSIYTNKNSKETTRRVLKYICISITLLIVSIIINFAIIKTMYFYGIEETEWVDKKNVWTMLEAKFIPAVISIYIKTFYSTIVKYLPVTVFLISSSIGFVISGIESLKKKNVLIFLIFLGMCISNFAISIILLQPVLFRICQSWTLFVTFSITVFYLYVLKSNILKNIAVIIITLLVLYQTKELNQLFYNDYIVYQKSLFTAKQVIYDTMRISDTTKTLVIVGKPPKGIGRNGSQSNSLSILYWGVDAFEENGTEFINFLNSLGYKFAVPNDEQYEKGISESENMPQYPKEGYIKEFGDFIIVKF